MSDKARIEQLEQRVAFLEETLQQTMRQVIKLTDLLLKLSKPQQTDCAWK